MDLKEALIFCSMIPGIGRKKTIQLINIMKQNKYNISIENIIEIIHRNYSINIKSIDSLIFMKDKILNDSIENNIKIITIFDREYPINLSNIPDPPAILYLKGSVKALHQKSFAIIGTRQPSKEGQSIAYYAGKKVSHCGFTIVSGLASGCDTYGHKGCLDVKGMTIAFLPSGINKIYPSSNKYLAERIIENGALVSEYPPNSLPEKYKFIERDRLQAGLSDAVFVVETELKGGTMHTVTYSCKYKKNISAYNFLDMKKNNRKGNLSLINSNLALPISNLKELDNFIISMME